MSRQNLAIVDVQNLFLAARSEYGSLARLDFVKLKNLICSLVPEDEDLNIVAYVLVSPHHEDKRFVKFLKNWGFKVLRHYVKGTTSQALSLANSDYASRMVRESLFLTNQHDGDIIIVSGNGHFQSLVSNLVSKNKKVSIVAFPSSIQDSLKNSATVFISLNNSHLYNENLYKTNHGKTSEVSNITNDVG